jgi:hypothetical protein
MKIALEDCYNEEMCFAEVKEIEQDLEHVSSHIERLARASNQLSLLGAGLTNSHIPDVAETIMVSANVALAPVNERLPGLESFGETVKRVGKAIIDAIKKFFLMIFRFFGFFRTKAEKEKLRSETILKALKAREAKDGNATVTFNFTDGDHASIFGSGNINVGHEIERFFNTTSSVVKSNINTIKDIAGRLRTINDVKDAEVQVHRLHSLHDVRGKFIGGYDITFNSEKPEFLVKREATGNTHKVSIKKDLKELIDVMEVLAKNFESSIKQSKDFEATSKLIESSLIGLGEKIDKVDDKALEKIIRDSTTTMSRLVKELVSINTAFVETGSKIVSAIGNQAL